MEYLQSDGKLEIAPGKRRNKFKINFGSNRKGGTILDINTIVRVVAGVLAAVILSVIVYRRKQANS
jgi:hypothetical protein